MIWGIQPLVQSKLKQAIDNKTLGTSDLRLNTVHVLITELIFTAIFTNQLAWLSETVGIINSICLHAVIIKRTYYIVRFDIMKNVFFKTVLSVRMKPY